MEMLLLSVLGPSLQCEWHLSSSQVALITTIVFVGFFIGAPLWGMISDKYGRWITFFIVLSMIAYFGFMTAFSPSYFWIVFIRGIVGFAIGGASASFTLISEYLPSKYRAKILIVYQVTWACGSTFEIFMAYMVLPHLGWRWLVGLSAVPMLIFICMLKLLPESARYLMASNRKSEALSVLAEMARANGKQPMIGELVSPLVSESRGSMTSLFNSQYRRTTLTLLIIWFGIAFTYYGIILISSEIFRFHHNCFGDKISVATSHYENVTDVVDTSCCKSISLDDYKAMLISSFGEFVVIPLNLLTIDFLGRRVSLAKGFFISSIFFGLLYLCVDRSTTTGFLFMIRAFAAGCFNMLYIYTTEVYPTTVRSFGTGVCSAVARLGSMTTPYIAQVVMPEVSVLAALLIYVGVNILCSVCCMSLPIETKNRAMPQSVEPPTVSYRRSEPEQVTME